MILNEQSPLHTQIQRKSSNTYRKNKTLSAHALFKGYTLCQKKCVTNRPDSRTKWPLRTWSRDFVPNRYQDSLHEHRYISSSNNPVSRGELLTNTSPRFLLTVTFSERKYIHNFFEMFHLIGSASCCVFEVF